jgi:membrane protease YdiL (CAAX protease family)
MVHFAVLFYGPLILFAYALLLWRHGWGLFRPEPGWIAWSVAAALLALGVVVLSRWLGGRFSWARDMEGEFLQVLGPLTPMEAVALALLSGIGEEAFFRGVLQPRLGLLWTTTIFGAVHVPFSVRLIPWTIFAWLMGLVLGLLFDWSGSLVPPVVAHALINGINLMALGIKARQLGVPRRTFEPPGDDPGGPFA